MASTQLAHDRGGCRGARKALGRGAPEGRRQPPGTPRDQRAIKSPIVKCLFCCSHAATYSIRKIRYPAPVRKPVSTPQTQSRLQDSGLTDTEILLLLDMCLSAETKCDERLADAIRGYQGA